MKALLRCGFVALIASTLAIQTCASWRSNADNNPMVSVASGLSRLGIQTERPMTTDILAGHSTSCELPIHVMLLPIGGQEDERVSDLGLANEATRYIYLGSVRAKRSEAVVLGRWLLARARFVVGFSPVNPSDNLILVLLPRACGSLGTMEWATLSPWQ